MLYFIKTLFLYIDEDTKLKIIKYNKRLQNILGIKMINYKYFSKKYIVYEKNNIAKEYNINGHLLFKGQYLNGKRNGKGVESYLGNIEFEGNFVDGKKNGYGEEYDCDGNPIFKGEYLNGHKWNGKGYDADGEVIYEIQNGNGKIKVFDRDRDLLFEGELKNGKIEGEGKEYNYKDIIFEGEYKKGKRHGKGKDYILGSLIFDGDYYQGLPWNGKGYKDNEVVYEIKNGNGYIPISGKRRMELFDTEYDGEFVNGKPNGKGKEYESEDFIEQERKLKYEGEYLCGKRNGKGKIYFHNQVIYEGEFLYNMLIYGKYYVKGRLQFEGEYNNAKPWNGKGYDENGNVVYEIKDGNGRIQEFNLKGDLIYDGEYKNGKK